MKTIVFIDGYNLYYGVVRRTPYKWLDIVRLFQEHILLPDTELLEVRYYTAPVLGSLCDDPESPQRQRQYLQALRKLHPEKLTILEGKLVKSTPILRLAEAIPEAPGLTTAKVITLTEKKTDVNIASDMLSAVFLGQCEQVVLCSNDSDMEGALKAIRQHCPTIRVGLAPPIANPDYRRICKELKTLSHWVKIPTLEAMAEAQLPNKIPGTSITKPGKW
jgi:6-hydroxy-3-succinoylpyridine 3-monooxygenase